MNLQFCRVCMDSEIDSEGNLLAIEQTSFCSAIRTSNNLDFLDSKECLTYLDCFEFVTRIKVDLTTNSPQHLCTGCREELRRAFEFIRKAEEAEKHLQESIEKANIISEEEEDEVLQRSLLDFIEESSDRIPFDISIGEEHDDSVLGLQLNEFDVETDSNILEIDTPNIDDPLSFQNWNEETETTVLCGEEVPDQELQWHCRECKKNFKNKRSLYLHRYRFHRSSSYSLTEENDSQNDSQKKYHCTQCSRTYKTLSLLQSHQKYHERRQHSKKSDACPICGKQFASSNYLRQHTAQVHNSLRKLLACEVCDRQYLTKNALDNHKRIHNGKTIDCETCGKRFVNSYELKIHMRFHQRDYPFQCTRCDKKFAIKGHLRTHMFQHQGLKLQCEVCKKLFTSTKALLDHSYSHGKVMPFPCCYCSKGYPSKQKYKVHLAAVHSVEFNEMENITAMNASKPIILRKRNITLVHADSLNKKI